MKTSKQERVVEYEHLKWRNGRGSLLTRADILRYLDLRREMEPSTRNNDLKPVKAAEAQ
jgi:hypothetical protein